MKLDEYLMKELNISKPKAREIVFVIEKYKKSKKKKHLNINIPKYTLGEELFNSISHGIGAVFSIVALILMVVKAHGIINEATVSLFGVSMIILYVMSCIYHALPPSLEGKKVLRVIDHCNVFLLVFGTYIPVSLLGVGGAKGWILFGVIGAFTIIGIVFTAINVDKYKVIATICHVINGWSILIGIPELINNAGHEGLLFMILGGVMYTIGSVLYGLGSKKKYMHCIFHVFCLLGTFFHFWSIYMYLI